ncbi:sensor histidine kinase [Paenibacillus nanensis]|uniref:histidine kinase n=1 Tax=Paenibacillus nanensis TaxID=393251 RepID=A0A3A1UR52_9BACL|nr:sensor histidine kinase [Paenibacillus nanensis]RIX50734.1 sensor histidine kinase [Paenibacillus nanensis]
MRFLRFLAYERSYLYLCAASYALAIGIFYADPRSKWHWDTFWYGAALWIGMSALFFIYRYYRTERSLSRMGDEDTEPMSLESEGYRKELQRKETAHIRAMNEAQAKQRDTYDFIVSWFHEIKTPIAVLRLLQQTKLDPASVEEELSRIEHYVDMALYYAKLDSFHQDYAIGTRELEPIVRKVVKQYAKAFISKKIKMSMTLGGVEVHTDSKWLEFIVSQLLSNSLKYTEEEGEITITASVTGKEKLLTVRDNGVGIEAADLPRIFNRGFTGTNGRTKVKSTGMGLFLAQELSRKLGHYLTCRSSPGSFTEMTIHFPINHDPYLDALTGSAKASG